MASYERINYLLRPNKSVERKMVCEMLLAISTIKDLSSYQYIGFGSTYFADFSLFHRNLGMSKMVSIEKDDTARDRCEFNKPFSCIELKIGDSSTILPNLDINTKDSIVWLDYDGPISNIIFSDINTVVGMMRPDSFFMLSLNADFATLKYSMQDEGILEPQTALIDMIGVERYPNDFRDKKMNQRNYLKVLYHCLIQEIESAVRARNGLEEEKVKFHQSIYFDYRDGARMLTLGGFLFYVDEEDEHLNKMGIRQKNFYRHEDVPYSIQCPILSMKEIQALNAHLPCKEMGKHGNFEDEELNMFPVDNSEINQYAALYRYFPNFAETLI